MRPAKREMPVALDRDLIAGGGDFFGGRRRAGKDQQKSEGRQPGIQYHHDIRAVYYPEAMHP